MKNDIQYNSDQNGTPNHDYCKTVDNGIKKQLLEVGSIILC